MGQLERYGLYVLCLVIFLILGVAIWGEGEQLDPNHDVAQEEQNTTLSTETEKREEFADLLAKQNQVTFEKQKRAEDQGGKLDLFEPVDAGGKGRKDVHTGDAGGKKKQSPPRPVALRTHVVKSGDNLESISMRYLGKRQLWRKILAVNPGVTERNLQLGQKLKIPHAAAAAESVPPPVGQGQRYKVRKGDSAWGIAKDHYGVKLAQKYSKRILEANGITDAAMLKPGTFIVLPK